VKQGVDNAAEMAKEASDKASEKIKEGAQHVGQKVKVVEQIIKDAGRFAPSERRPPSTKVL
jgi:hypothetical protein